MISLSLLCRELLTAYPKAIGCEAQEVYNFAAPAVFIAKSSSAPKCLPKDMPNMMYDCQPD